MTHPAEQLKALGISLPPVSTPAAAYVPFVRSGPLVFLSGPEGGLSPDEAFTEAWRCLSCGNCIECDGCLGSCPEDAVIKLGKGLRYRYDYAKCTGCGTCYEQCPVHAIEMIAER